MFSIHWILFFLAWDIVFLVALFGLLETTNWWVVLLYSRRVPSCLASSGTSTNWEEFPYRKFVYNDWDFYHAHRDDYRNAIFIENIEEATLDDVQFNSMINTSLNRISIGELWNSRKWRKMGNNFLWKFMRLIGLWFRCLWIQFTSHRLLPTYTQYIFPTTHEWRKWG